MVSIKEKIKCNLIEFITKNFSINENALNVLIDTESIMSGI
ncbi:hypothetical protein bcgnr5383_39680 [Bacillus cereus]